MQKLTVITFLIFLISGCATTSDVENIQAQITSVKHDVRELHKTTTTAKYAVERATMRIDRAYVASRLALQVNKELNDKVNSQVK